MTHLLLLLLFAFYTPASTIDCFLGCDANDECDKSTGVCLTMCNVSNDPPCRDGTFCKQNRCVGCSDDGIGCPYYQRCYNNICVNGLTLCESDNDCLESAYCKAGVCDALVCNSDDKRTIINHACTEAIPACYPTSSGNSCPINASLCLPVCATHVCVYKISSVPVECSDTTCLYTTLYCNPYSSICNFTGTPLRVCKPLSVVIVPRETVNNAIWLSNSIIFFCLFVSLLLLLLLLCAKRLRSALFASG
jgi:hypothetical protein